MSRVNTLNEQSGDDLHELALLVGITYDEMDTL